LCNSLVIEKLTESGQTAAKTARSKMLLLATAPLAAALHEPRPLSRRQAAVHPPLSRRQAFLGMGCACCVTRPDVAHGLATLAQPDVARYERFALQRDAAKDAGFARGMKEGMGQYETAVAPTKARLFERLFAAVHAAVESAAEP
jgi:hypothetical protein